MEIQMALGPGNRAPSWLRDQEVPALIQWMRSTKSKVPEGLTVVEALTTNLEMDKKFWGKFS